jgi:hypothetical protein
MSKLPHKVIDFTEAEIARSQNSIANLFDAAGLTHDLEAGTDAELPNPAKFTSAANALRFMIAGDAVITLHSKKSDKRFTYRISMKKEDQVGPRGRVYFVSVLVGPDNTKDFTYLGYFFDTQMVYWHGTKKSKIGKDAPSAVAFDWTWRMLQKGVLPEKLEIWHEGRCGRCNRPLTVPSSIASGFGPECIHKI